MSKNYLIYPCKTMRITQSYTGTTSHLPHTTGSPKDYPWDEGCSGSGRDYCYCPCDEMIVKRITGVGNGYTNTIWLESTTPVNFADGTEDYCTMLITHPNDDDLKEIDVGDTFKRGEEICREGKDGATGYHFHFSAGKGKFRGNGWTGNSKGKYVLTTTNGTYKPEKLFYVDPAFTKISNSKGLKFENLPKEYELGKYVVDVDLLNIRKGPGTEYPRKKYHELSKKAQRVIKQLTGGREADGYVKGQEFTVCKIKNGCWGYNASGYMCLDYCTKIEEVQKS